ncbi:hypothetical protein REPUB_Repub05bG0073500 [Reevesia pubescens]
MGYSESTNVKDSVTMPPLEAEVKALSEPPTVSESISKKKHKKNRKRSCFLLCCSNVELENEEEKKEAFSFMENSNRSCMTLCFSNFEVGPKTKSPGLKYQSKPLLVFFILKKKNCKYTFI